MEKINAKEAVEKYGQKLIGKQVETARYGGWPGGLCEITEIEPDANAPEIVFQVRHHIPAQGEIGIFENEEIGLFPESIGWAMSEAAA